MYPTRTLPPSSAGIRLDDLYFSSREEVRWLGYWFTPSLSTNSHFSRRLALAQGAFDAVKSLSPPGKGLPPYLCHRLATSLIAPVLLYGADLFTPLLKMQDKLDTFWRRIQRWVTNCFSSTPIPILAIESCLPPLALLIEHRQRVAALRAVSSPPEINPVAARFHKSVPNRSSFRTPDCHRRLLVKLNPAKRPLMWKTPKANIQKHLPIDQITHRILPFLENRSSLPLLDPHLVPTLVLPEPDVPANSFITLKKESRAILLRQWSSLAPLPPGYSFRTSLTPHAFMGLSKFLAGRLHQMRAGKSSLAAHPSWFNKDLPSLCPSCRSAPENFGHAILHCEARQMQRRRLLQGASTVDELSPLWSSPVLITALASYIDLTATGFPRTCSPPPQPQALPPPPPSLFLPHLTHGFPLWRTLKVWYFSTSVSVVRLQGWSDRIFLRSL